MSTTQSQVCRYRYDALDQLTGLESIGQPALSRFYCAGHFATQLCGQATQSVMQHGSQPLMMQSREGGQINSQLMVTDQQRSVLHAGSTSQIYAPYGHRRVEGNPGSPLGFIGEVIDPVTGHYLFGNGHRAFNPVLMRFNRADSLSPFGQGGLNPYAYCLGDPLNLSDPTGRFAELARLLTSVTGLINTRMGMSAVIPSYKLAKDALRWGAAGQLPARQTFAAASTVVASGAIFMTAMTGVGSAIAGLTGDTDTAKTLGFIALGLTAMAMVSRVGTYWAARDPKVEADLRSFVQARKQPAATPLNMPDGQPPASPIPSAPFPHPDTFKTTHLKLGKRTYDEMLELELNRPSQVPRRQRPLVNSNKKIRRI